MNFARIPAGPLTGKYNFKKSNGDIDVDAMVNALEKHLKRHLWKAA